jgi:hypothetical protein
MKVVLVAGLPRSGTTAFAKNLARYGRSLYLGESHAMSTCFSQSSRVSSDDINRLVMFVRSRNSLNTSDSNKWEEARRSMFAATDRQYDFMDWLKFLYLFGKKSNYDVVIDDCPDNYRALARHFEEILGNRELSVFLLKRRYQAVLQSHLRSPWGKMPAGRYCLKYWRYSRVLNKCSGQENIVTVPYEHLPEALDSAFDGLFRPIAKRYLQKEKAKASIGRVITERSELIGDVAWNEEHFKKTIRSPSEYEQSKTTLDDVALDRVTEYFIRLMDSKLYERSRFFQLAMFLPALIISRLSVLGGDW